MSQLEEIIRGKARSTAPNGLTMLRYGWPALLLCAGFVWAQVVQPLGSPEAGAAFALSPDALAEGRWWTVLTHMFASGLGGFFLAILTFAAACTAVVTRDPDWMGGWRTPVMFVACGLVGALVHLLTAGGAPLLSSWPAVFGLVAYWLASRRLPAWEASGGRVEKPEPETWLTRGFSSLWAWAFPWTLYFIGPRLWDIQLPFVLSPMTVIVVAVGGGVVLFGLTAMGGIARRIAGLVQIVFGVTLMGVMLAKGLGEIDFDIPLVVAMVGGLMFGGLLGFKPRPAAAQ